MSKDKNSLAKTEAGGAIAIPADVLAQMQVESGAGFEDLSSRDFAIPFLKLIQANSPQLDPTKAEYIPEAKPMKFLNSGTGELMDSARIIPCYHIGKMVEWKPRALGGGFVASHEVGYEEKLKKDDRGRFLATGADGKENGNHIMDTRYFFCLLVQEDSDPTPIVLAMASTQIKVAKNWNTKIESIRVAGADGKKFKPAWYSHIFKLSAVPQSNQFGSWFGFKIETEGPITSMELLDQAKKAREMFKKSAVNVKPAEDRPEEE